MMYISGYLRFASIDRSVSPMTLSQPLLSSMAPPVASCMVRDDAGKEWDSPAYEVLKQHSLLREDWRVSDVSGLDFLEGNTTPMANCCRAVVMPCGGCLCFKMAEVPSGAVRKLEDGRGGFAFLGNRGPHKGIHVRQLLSIR